MQKARTKTCLTKCHPCTWGLGRNLVAGGPHAVPSVQSCISPLAAEAVEERLGEAVADRIGGGQEWSWVESSVH